MNYNKYTWEWISLNFLKIPVTVRVNKILVTVR